MPKKARELSALEVKRLTKPTWHPVGGVASLGLQITPSGAKSWVLRLMVGGRRRHMGLGGYPDVSLADARDAARAAREEARKGIDPIDAKKAAKQALVASRAKDVTFRTCAEIYVESHRAGWKNAKHEAQWQSTLETYAYPVIGDMWVRDVKLEHILQILEPIWKSKTETATRLRGRIEAVLDSAITKGLYQGLNPARWKGNLSTLLSAPNKIKKVVHFKAMPIEETPAFFTWLRQQEGVSAKALEFLILTNVRSHNVRHASWSEIDMKSKTWIIPGEDVEGGSKQRMKMGVSHRVPLSKAAIKLLEGLPRMAGTDLIFPSPRKGGPLSDMAMNKVMREAQVKGVPHGFRSTFRDWVAERTDFSREVAEHALAHKVGDKVEAAYLRSDVFDKRRLLMERWAEFCESSTKRKGVVVALHQ